MKSFKLHDVVFAGPYDVGMGINSFRGQAPPPQSPSWPDSGMGMEGPQNANRSIKLCYTRSTVLDHLPAVIDAKCLKFVWTYSLE